MNAKSAFSVVLIMATVPATAITQWEQVNAGITTYRFERAQEVEVTAVPCATLYSSQSLNSPTTRCVPTGTTGNILLQVQSGFLFVDYTNGQSGYTLSSDLTHTLPDIHCLRKIGSALFAGTSKNTFRTTDFGASWSQTNSDWLDPHHDYWSAGEFAVMGDILFASCAANPYYTTDEGSSWRFVGEFDDFMVYSLDASRTCLFVTRPNGLRLRTRDMGTSWDTISCPGQLAIIDTVLFTEQSNGQIDASFDDGSTWVNVRSGIPPPGRACDLHASGNFLIDLEDVTGFGLSPTRLLWTGSVLVASSQMAFPAGFPTGLTTGSIRTNGSNIMLGFGGTYFSSNSGGKWCALQLPPGVSATSPFEIAGNYLLVGGTGVWRTPLDVALQVSPPAVVPPTVTLSQNYPNPFNPTTTIKYRLPVSSMVRLRVYDVLGREVSVLANGRQNAGTFEVKFDGTDLASGVYIFRLQAGDIVQAKRMLLLK